MAGALPPQRRRDSHPYAASGRDKEIIKCRDQQLRRASTPLSPLFSSIMTRVRAREERPDRLVSCPLPSGGAPDTLRGAIVPAEAYAIPLSRCFEGAATGVSALR